MFSKILKMRILRHTKRQKHDWIQPQGFNTNIKIYNCLVKDKVPLIVKNKDQVSWYTCGPTVYDSAHIGHASCYVKLDLIQRILRNYFRLNLVTVMNITDIDDKIIKRSIDLSVTSLELARKFESEFWEDVKKLNIVRPDVVVRVTDHIPVISDFIKKILDSGKAYIVDDGSVYFDLIKCKDNYGKLAPLPTENTENTKKHVDVSFKKSEHDFAVWKSSKPNEPSWKTNFGSGRPGWHSECSALASAVFGNQIDIHAGGIDLRFPHHENEEAISCVHHGTKQWVNYWMHTGHLHLVGQDAKMSKSLGNCVYIREMFTQNQNVSDIFRMACAMSHYRANMEYGEDLMITAEKQLNTFNSFINNCDAYTNLIAQQAEINIHELNAKLNEAEVEIDLALRDDFNTSKVVKILSDLVSTTNKMLQQPKNISTNEGLNLSDCAAISILGNFVRRHFNLLGFTANLESQENTNIDAERTASILKVLIAFRQNIRAYGLQHKDSELLKYCDSLRDELKIYGFEIKDRGKLSSWNKL